MITPRLPALAQALPLAALCLFRLAPAGDAQCLTATVDPYDCGAPNPIILSTELPGQYPVLGSQFFVAAHGALPNSTGMLLISNGTSCLTLAPKYSGDLLINPLWYVSVPYAGIPAWEFFIPNLPSLAGLPFTMQSVHSKPGGFELSNGLECRIGYFQAEIGVTDVDPPPGLVGSQGSAPVAVTLHNYGNEAVFVPVHVTIGASPGDKVLGPVPAFGSFTGTVSVPVPPSSGTICGGDSNTFDVTACLSNFIDCNPDNNCKSTTTQIAVPYYDLKVEITNNASTAHLCGSTNWKVRVTNVGNAPSQNVPLLTAINCSPGPGNYSCNLGKDFFSSGVLGPGDASVHDVFLGNPYLIPCGAFPGVQYIKAEINYAAGGVDDCNITGNNYDEAAINIL